MTDEIYIKLNEVLDAFSKIDEQLYGSRGLCYLYGAGINIDSGIPSDEVLKTVLEHEMTHRNDIYSSHFGNICNLLKQVQSKFENFTPNIRNKLNDIMRYLSTVEYRNCLEGHACYNQRLITGSVPEDVWLSRLQREPDQHYYAGYKLAADIMNHFKVIDSALPNLADSLLLMPLKYIIKWLGSGEGY